MKTYTDAELVASIELMTQSILMNGAGVMLAADMSESAVIRKAENVAKEYHERMVNRYNNLLKENQAFPD